MKLYEAKMKELTFILDECINFEGNNGRSGVRSLEEVFLAKRLCGDLSRKLRRTLFAINPNPTREQAFEIAQRPEIRQTVLLIASIARQYAQNHRDFDVGTILIGLREVTIPGENPWVVRHSANTRESVYVFKYCGELRLDDQAKASNVRHVILLCIVGQPNLDHGSGKQSDTLTPCEICRYRFRLTMSNTGIMQLDTLIVTANHYDLEHPEFWTVETLHAFHGEDVYNITIEVVAELRC